MNLSAILGPGPLTGLGFANNLAKYKGGAGTPVNYDAGNKLIAALHQFDHHDEAYLLTSLETGEITWSQGILKWLGYPDVVPGMPLPPDYLSQHIPVSVRTWYQVFINAAILAMKEEKVEYLATRFVINIPLRRPNGQVTLVKQMMMPFHFDSKKRIVSLIHSFTLFGDHREGDPLQPGVFHREEKKDHIYEKIIQKVAGACRPIFPKENLTRAHFEQLDVLAELRKTPTEINLDSMVAALEEGKSEKRARDSVRSSLDVMKRKLLSLVGEDNNDKVALDVIQFFQRSGFTDVLRVIWEKETGG